MNDPIQTWHHGLMARWWSLFSQDPEDVAAFAPYIEQSGEPVLDAGCGTGRLLLPLLRKGIDIHGSDVSQDMLDRCQHQADIEGLTTTLYPSAMHELEVPTRFKTIIVCGAFGLGGSRAQDLEGLRRLHRHLQPGGVLVMDHYLPHLESPKTWPAWVEKPDLPRPWPRRGDRRKADDNTELELRVRQLNFNPLEQTTTLEMQLTEYIDGEQSQRETNRIDINLYFKQEIELMLDIAGFHDVEVTSFGEQRVPNPWEDARILFRASA